MIWRASAWLNLSGSGDQRHAPPPNSPPSGNPSRNSERLIPMTRRTSTPAAGMPSDSSAARPTPQNRLQIFSRKKAKKSAKGAEMRDGTSGGPKILS
jgi:hypothetical protein